MHAEREKLDLGVISRMQNQRLRSLIGNLSNPILKMELEAVSKSLY